MAKPEFHEYPKHVTVNGVVHVVTSAEHEARVLATDRPAKKSKKESV